MLLVSKIVGLSHIGLVLVALVVLLIAGNARGNDVPISGEFSMLSYNVNGLPPITGAQPNPQKRNRLTGALLNAYPLALIQEDFFYHDELSADANHPHQTVPGDPICLRILFFRVCFPGTDVDGLMRFSNFPFAEVYEEAWNDCSSQEASDCFTTKGFAAAHTEISPGVFVDIYNLHMDAGGSDRDHVARANQVEQLLATINSRSVGRAIIVSGDTNSRPGRAPGNDELPSDDEVLARLLSGAGLVDACKVVQANTCDEQIDRIMYRSGDGVILQAIDWYVDESFIDEEGHRLSDHPAIAVKFVWSQIPVRVAIDLQ
jgi:hypothetical protein